MRRMGEKGNMRAGFGEGKGPQVRLSFGREYNIKVDPKELLHEGVKRNCLGISKSSAVW